MDIARTGVIINTERYDECVSFYKNLFGLTVMFEEQHGEFRLTCFDFAGSYLMIETGGHARPEGKTMNQSSTKLRFNVSNIEEALETIRAYGIDAQIIRNDWGSTINILTRMATE